MRTPIRRMTWLVTLTLGLTIAANQGELRASPQCCEHAARKQGIKQFVTRLNLARVTAGHYWVKHRWPQRGSSEFIRLSALSKSNHWHLRSVFNFDQSWEFTKISPSPNNWDSWCDGINQSESSIFTHWPIKAQDLIRGSPIHLGSSGQTGRAHTDWLRIQL